MDEVEASSIYEKECLVVTLVELKNQAEDLKMSLWAYMEQSRKEHNTIRLAMNELLDLIDELEVLT